MKTLIRYFLICFITLSPALCRAEVTKVEQNFDDMYKASPKELVDSNSGQTGTTDFVTYTCHGAKAKIFQDLFNPEGGKKIAINLEEKDNYVTTSAISNLQRVEIDCSAKKDKSKIKVYISTDGSSWEEPDNITYVSRIVATFAAGDYYIKILNTITSNKVSIYQIDYTYIDLSGCPNCFIYRPE